MKFNKIKGGSIDPRIQFHEILGSISCKPTSSSEDTSHKISVIGIVSDIKSWKALCKHENHSNIFIKENLWIVTGKLSINKLKTIHDLPFIHSIKAAQSIHPTLHATIDDLGLDSKESLTCDTLGKGGKGVIVGVVDFGCDFEHRNFLQPDGSSRILSIWDQSAEATKNSPFGYGQVFTQAQINKALATKDPYKTLGYTPGTASRGTHGTHVMDIAAGSHPKYPGVAPKADLIFVDLRSERHSTPEAVVDHDLGDSVRLIEAIHYIFEQAGDRPCVVNLSLGTNGGPHDGSNPVEQAIDAMVNAKPNRAVVIAAGNAQTHKVHQSGQLTQGESTELLWSTPTFDFTRNEVEIWYSGKDELEFELIDANGKVLCQMGLGENGYLTDEKDRMVFFISHRKKDPNNHDNVIHIFQQRNTAGGKFTLRLRGKRIQDTGIFHAWIERDATRFQSQFVCDDTSHTLGSLSTGRDSIIVGSYDAHKADCPLSFFSSSGPTRDGRQKPDISAPGHEVWAARSKSKNRLTKKSGTSMAAPAVTGVIARLFARAKQLGKSLNIKDLKKILTDTARKVPSTNRTANGWHPRYGYGRLYAKAALHHPFFKSSKRKP